MKASHTHHQQKEVTVEAVAAQPRKNIRVQQVMIQDREKVTLMFSPLLKIFIAAPVVQLEIKITRVILPGGVTLQVMHGKGLCGNSLKRNRQMKR